MLKPIIIFFKNHYKFQFKILKIKLNNSSEIRGIKYDKPRILENNIYVFIEENNDTIEFFSKIFANYFYFDKKNEWLGIVH